VASDEIDSIISNILFIKPMFFKALVNSKGLMTIVNPGTYYIMLALEKHKALSMSTIGSAVSMPRPNVTALVDKMISDRLAERTPDPKDRRIIKIGLTRKGYKTKKLVDKALKEHTSQKLSSLSDSEIKQLSSSLTKVRNIFAKLPKENN